jgi:hypothetical protein
MNQEDSSILRELIKMGDMTIYLYDYLIIVECLKGDTILKVTS